MFDRQLSLERTTCPTKQSMIGALVRAALACQGENNQQSGEWKHVLRTRSGGARQIEELAEDEGCCVEVISRDPEGSLSASEGGFHGFGPPS
jgi:hypothetical protein